MCSGDAVVSRYMYYVGSNDLDLGVQCSHHDRLAIGEAVTCVGYQKLL